MAFIDDHRGRFGVEPICRVLSEHEVKIAPSTYYAAKTRAPSARAVNDEVVLGHVSAYDLMCRCVYDLMCRSVFGES